MRAPAKLLRRLGPWVLAAALVLGVAAGSMLVGPGGFGIADVLEVVRARLQGAHGPRVADAILWELRFPRIVLAILVGAALGGAGAVTQGLFRNPLAEPGILGISTGAAVVVVAGFVFGLDRALWVTPLLAAVGAAGVLAALFLLSAGSPGVATLLLMGVALSAVLGAVMTLLLSFTFARWDLAQKAVSWLMGSFDGRGWDYVRWGSPPLVAACSMLVALHRPLDALRLGEDTAATLGVHRRRLRTLAAAAVAMASGAATAMVGVIGFVGLVVPHLARSLVPPSHAHLIPASMLLGATLMVAVDTLTRSVSPLHLPPGAITSLVGGIFVIVLLRRRGLTVA